MVMHRSQSIALKVGKSLDNTPLASAEARSKLSEYVYAHGGDAPIHTILIANNGMAATKAIMSMRSWAYFALGDAKCLTFVAMASTQDLDANAEFVRLADRVVEVPSGSNKHNYANVDLILEIATREGVDAVWPGWGHASENPLLPEGLAARGIVFIGPNAGPMRALGDKIAASILAQTAEVPQIPWSGDGLIVDPKIVIETGAIPPEIFRKAMVTTAEECVVAALRIGYPVMLKASEGGGGKGIRMSYSEAELRVNFVQVSNEVPGSPMFMMQLCTNARHLEVQIVGDMHGQAVALSGRDCSTQRRFQKIFEEGPPIIAPPEVFREMELAAMRLTQSIGYHGAGTVEYLFHAATNKYYFLELNPRLQVEHPVTEGITGVNMPATQLQVSMGIPLNRVPDVRKFYGKADQHENTPIDFFKEQYVPVAKHVIAARITAENPDEGFKPTSGSIERVKFQSTPDVWGYFSVGANGGIHEFADSQFGHVFASGPNRDRARHNLIHALKSIEVRGQIRNPVEYLGQLLDTVAFKDNTIHTGWLDGIIREKSVATSVADAHTSVVAAALFRAHAHVKKSTAQFVASLKKGQLSTSGVDALLQFPLELCFEGVKYSFDCSRTASDAYALKCNGLAVVAKLREQPDGSLLANFGGITRKVVGIEEPLGLRVVVDGATALMPTVFDPSELRTDVTGKVVRFLQEDGASVAAGAPYVEVEAMKMIMALKAGEGGIISHKKTPGSIISTGDLIAQLELADPTKVAKIESFFGIIAYAKASQVVCEHEQAIDALFLALLGFECSQQRVKQLVERLALNSDCEQFVRQATSLLAEYVRVEGRYSCKSRDAVVSELIAEYKDSLEHVIACAMAHAQLARRTELALLIMAKLLAIYSDKASHNVKVAPPALVGVLAQLSALDGCFYGEVALLALRCGLVAADAPPTPRGLDTTLFDKNGITNGYALTELETGTTCATAYLGMKLEETKTSAVVFVFYTMTQDAFTLGVDGVRAALENVLDAVSLARRDSKTPATSSSTVALRVPTGWGHVDADAGLALLDAALALVAPKLHSLHVDALQARVGSACNLAMALPTSANWPTLQAATHEELDLYAPPPSGSRRAAARRAGSTFCFDFVGLFARATAEHGAFKSDELVYARDGETLEPQRGKEPGTNAIGMVAWHCAFNTAEYPSGRELVLIANDVTIQSGSFGVREDDYFLKASQYARSRGLPRVYLACNSGARIGLVEDLKPLFKVAWLDASNPALGYSYLYLTERDHASLPEGTVQGHFVDAMGELRFVMEAIVGVKHGIGVENLRGSGTIAGETSRAYQDAFTLSYVTGRSVGIGAYLVRLGQRCIQNEVGPLILTGYSALNKLLGREVYTSQDQLGGPQVMHPNGVSHLTVSNDVEGVAEILRWLSFVPKTKWALPPALALTDPVERDVAFLPSKAPYDPRHMLAGATVEGAYQSGFFDHGTFKEYLSGWGKSVVVGRARLGGIPMGCIAVETRLSEQRVPADPANPDSHEAVLPQAGQVWYPDSAYKTAQAIRDFTGEGLPIIIFANWRGFSGGTRDMFGEILKFGAMIVDALVACTAPVTVYIPPFGELRGGAWVVVDPTINSEFMEMYADQHSRGGILEAPGICEVKYKKADQLKTMHRLDTAMHSLDTAASNGDARAQDAVKDREDALGPLYAQVAHEFADLHDKAGRMKAKGVIREILTWTRSREFLFWRTKRRLAEDALRGQIANVTKHAPLERDAVTLEIEQLAGDTYGDDRAFLHFLENDETFTHVLARLKLDSSTKAIQALLQNLTLDQQLAALKQVQQ